MPLPTKDILYLSLSASAVALTIFLCWSLYYLLTSLKQINQMVATIKHKFDAVLQFVEHLKNKAETTATAATAISQAAVEIVKFVKTKKEEHGKKEDMAE